MTNDRNVPETDLMKKGAPGGYLKRKPWVPPRTAREREEASEYTGEPLRQQASGLRR
ncbi:hypothetical protein ACFFX0_23410 [Citricoccus parietis]|uniref:Uncharacterized protein n=1 Tax=Citricoccus parietis TaxID=592307 RepID=A0ABV5G4W5_9MICC